MSKNQLRWVAVAALGAVTAAVIAVALPSPGPRCTPGRPIWARGGKCVQFCQADGRSVYPVCMVPHQEQLPDVLKLAQLPEYQPEPERHVAP